MRFLGTLPYTSRIANSKQPTIRCDTKRLMPLPRTTRRRFLMYSAHCPSFCHGRVQKTAAHGQIERKAKRARHCIPPHDNGSPHSDVAVKARDRSDKKHLCPLCGAFHLIYSPAGLCDSFSKGVRNRRKDHHINRNRTIAYRFRHISYKGGDAASISHHDMEGSPFLFRDQLSRHPSCSSDTSTCSARRYS